MSALSVPSSSGKVLSASLTFLSVVGDSLRDVLRSCESPISNSLLVTALDFVITTPSINSFVVAMTRPLRVAVISTPRGV